VALVVITGGARSGKSAVAQRLARSPAALGAHVTVVVFGRADTDDPEFAMRVARHRADRPRGFRTVEASDSAAWREAVPADGLLVVDCLGTLLGLAMEEAWTAAQDAGALADAAADALPEGVEAACEHAMSVTVEWLTARPGDTLVVTNEVGDGIVPSYASGRLFRDLLGRANRMLVACADAAYLVVAGRLIALGSLPDEALWPED
jgi:adenosylcobinamide kinase/adenosylcobinamide-phosphate guanylyltransferase